MSVLSANNFNVTSAPPNALLTHLVQPSGSHGSRSLVDCTVPGSRLVQNPNGTVEVMPKTPAEIAGERMLRPLIDKTSSLFRYSFDLLKTGFNKFDALATRIVSFLPGAEAKSDTSSVMPPCPVNIPSALWENLHQVHERGKLDFDSSEFVQWLKEETVFNYREFTQRQWLEAIKHYEKAIGIEIAGRTLCLNEDPSISTFEAYSRNIEQKTGEISDDDWTDQARVRHDNLIYDLLGDFDNPPEDSVIFSQHVPSITSLKGDNVRDNWFSVEFPLKSPEHISTFESHIEISRQITEKISELKQILIPNRAEIEKKLTEDYSKSFLINLTPSQIKDEVNYLESKLMKAFIDRFKTNMARYPNWHFIVGIKGDEQEQEKLYELRDAIFHKWNLKKYDLIYLIYNDGFTFVYPSGVSKVQTEIEATLSKNLLQEILVVELVVMALFRPCLKIIKNILGV